MSWQKVMPVSLEDYKQYFGKYPDRIGAIAIMTDTDNTGESATAFYGPIRILTDAGKK